MLKFRSRVMRARGLRAFAPCALRRRCGPVLSWARFQEDSIHLLLSSCFVLIFVRDLACFRISFPAIIQA